MCVLDVSWGEMVVSTSPLTASATGPAALVLEPYVCPLATKDTDIVSPFGQRDVLAVSTAPVSGVPKSEMHEGIDYSANLGTEVRAARSGKVLFTGFSKSYVSRADKTVQSRLVIIRHADGQSSRYVHLGAFRVRPGQDVRAGQVIGVVAASDEWVAPVLHFEIRNIQGQAIDPETLITEVDKP